MRPAVPGRWRRFLLRSGFIYPNPSELRWLLADLDQPGGGRRQLVASWWFLPLPAYFVGAGARWLGASWPVALTADARNTTDRATFGTTLTATVEVESGERFEGSTRIRLGPGETVSVDVLTDLTGSVTVCEARVPEFLSRVKTNP